MHHPFLYISARLPLENAHFHVLCRTWTQEHDFLFFFWTSIPIPEKNANGIWQIEGDGNKRDKILSSATSLLEWCFRSRRRRCCLRWCYTWRFAMMIFSATQHCNIVATLFRIVTTLFQHYNAVFPWKSSLRIVPCNPWKLKKWAANASLPWEVSLSLFAFTRDLIAFNTVLSS